MIQVEFTREAELKTIELMQLVNIERISNRAFKVESDVQAQMFATIYPTYVAYIEHNIIYLSKDVILSSNNTLYFKETVKKSHIYIKADNKILEHYEGNS